MKALRNIDVTLVSLLLKYSTPFLSISFLNFRKCCWLGLSAEIKVQTSKNYKTCKGRCKLCHINQTGQTTTWKETCIKFIKYAECKALSKHLWNLLRFLFHKNNFFTEKKTIVETISVTITDSSNVWCLDLYLINIFTKSTKAEMHRHYVQAGTLLFICYCWKSTFLMKIDMKIKIF